MGYSFITRYKFLPTTLCDMIAGLLVYYKIELSSTILLVIDLKNGWFSRFKEYILRLRIFPMPLLIH